MKQVNELKKPQENRIDNIEPPVIRNEQNNELQNVDEGEDPKCNAMKCSQLCVSKQSTCSKISVTPEPRLGSARLGLGSSF